MAFAFGVLVTYLYFERKYHQRILALVALPVALGMLLYAATIPADIEPLVPALQNNLLLTVHVATAIVAYGSFAIAFAGSYLFLLQTRHALAVLVTTGAGVVGALVGALTGGASADKTAFTYAMAAAIGVLIIMGIVDWITSRGRVATPEEPLAAGASPSRSSWTRSATAPSSWASRSSPSRSSSAPFGPRRRGAPTGAGTPRRRRRS